MKSFRTYLTENTDIGNQLEREFPGVVVEITDKSKWYPHKLWYLSSIVVPKNQRKQGLGTRVMTRLCQLADQQRATIALTPASDFGSSVARLKKFYARFGFFANTGRKADNSITGAMLRFPK